MVSASPDIIQPPQGERVDRMAVIRAIAVSTWLPWVIIAVGIGLRLANYLQARSIWIDEALLLGNVFNRSYADLLQPLGDHQAAPPGVLWALKVSGDLFGRSELALRLFPMIGGIASLFLFYALLRATMTRRLLVIPLLFFALNVPLISYASEAKQYSTDATAAVAVLLAAVWAAQNPLTAARATALTATGALALWFSQPAAFVVAGVGLGLFLGALLDRDGPRLRALLAVGLVWGAAFAVVYAVSLQHVAASDFLRRYWQAYMLPNLSWSLSSVEVIVDRIRAALSQSHTVTMNDTALLVLVVGAAALTARRRALGFVSVFPLLALLGAAVAGVYPFGSRVILFTVPILLLLIGIGLETVLLRTWRAMPALSVALLVLLAIHPVFELAAPFNEREDIKPLLEYVAARRLPGDKIYVYYPSQFPFAFYADQYHLNSADTIIGRSWQNLYWIDTRGNRRLPIERDLDRLRGSRYVWVILTTIHRDFPLYLNYLDQLGEQRDAFHGINGGVYLYDLSGS